MLRGLIKRWRERLKWRIARDELEEMHRWRLFNAVATRELAVSLDVLDVLEFERLGSQFRLCNTDAAAHVLARINRRHSNASANDAAARLSALMLPLAREIAGAPEDDGSAHPPTVRYEFLDQVGDDAGR